MEILALYLSSERHFLSLSDIDECAKGQHHCSADAVSSNTKGSYNCSCKPGYSGDGKNCSEMGDVLLFDESLQREIAIAQGKGDII